MAYYRQVGSVPQKRHTQFRDSEGRLYYEELMGEEGFSSDSSLLYHRGVPSAIVASEVWEPGDQSTTPNHPSSPATSGCTTSSTRLRPPMSTRSPGVGWCSATPTSGSRTSWPARSRRTTATPSATSACSSRPARGRWRRCSASCATARATTW
ncbi:hypothetical protein [Nocardioides zeae]